MKEYNNTTLKACITKTLKQEYPGHTVLKDKLGNTLKLPAFFVRYLSPSQTGSGMDFYTQTFIVEVRYRPDDKLPENELSTHLDLIGGQVADLLGFVQNGDFSARAEQIDYDITDGILIVIARYRIKKRVTQVQDPYMENMEEKQEVK